MARPTPALRDKALVIIGGSTGLGLSAARAFVSEGARVVIVGRDRTNLAKAQKALGKSARGSAGDATNPKIAESAIQMAIKSFGRFDGLYHVAGGSGRKMGDGPLDQITDDGWKQTLDLNLTSL